MMKRKHCLQNRAAGFTVVECLISLAICAMLMTAVAVAFNASLVNFRENEEMFQSINSARQALTRMTTQLRTADAVDPNVSATQCSFFTPASEDITYEFRAADKKLYLITNGNEYTLCDNVTAASFTRTLTTDGSNCKSVLMSLTVQCGASERTLSAAAVVRRAL
ncbi:MAG: prepilin-type N-terminal cleavage/methylation domain-containing protein [Sedimentisphaerales bacterium]|nr:prepilin-type N-terminal cleavage/methylation domain-containing protein [Sedimentisphaerales bacterium]